MSFDLDEYIAVITAIYYYNKMKDNKLILNNVTYDLLILNNIKYYWFIHTAYLLLPKKSMSANRIIHESF